MFKSFSPTLCFPHSFRTWLSSPEATKTCTPYGIIKINAKHLAHHSHRTSSNADGAKQTASHCTCPYQTGLHGLQRNKHTHTRAHTRITVPSHKPQGASIASAVLGCFGQGIQIKRRKIKHERTQRNQPNVQPNESEESKHKLQNGFGTGGGDLSLPACISPYRCVWACAAGVLLCV